MKTEGDLGNVYSAHNVHPSPKSPLQKRPIFLQHNVVSFAKKTYNFLKQWVAWRASATWRIHMWLLCEIAIDAKVISTLSVDVWVSHIETHSCVRLTHCVTHSCVRLTRVWLTHVWDSHMRETLYVRLPNVTHIVGVSHMCDPLMCQTLYVGLSVWDSLMSHT